MTRIYEAPVNRKLTLAQANEIRRLAATGVTQRTLASQYEVSKVTINGIVNDKFYIDPKRRSDAGTIRSGTETHFACGHPRDGNTRDNGTANGCCGICNRENAQRNRNAVKAAKAEREAARQRSNETAVKLYREEKAKAAHRRTPALTDAHRAFKAVLEREAIARKGGRPKGILNLHKPGRSRIDVRRDAIPDLTTQLQPFYGTGR